MALRSERKKKKAKKFGISDYTVLSITPYREIMVMESRICIILLHRHDRRPGISQRFVPCPRFLFSFYNCSRNTGSCVLLPVVIIKAGDRKTHCRKSHTVTVMVKARIFYGPEAPWW